MDSSADLRYTGTMTITEQADTTVKFALEYRYKGSTNAWPLWGTFQTEAHAWEQYKPVMQQNPQYEFRVVKATREVLEPKEEFEAGKTYQNKSLGQYLFTVEFVSPKTGVATGYDEEGEFYRRTPARIAEWKEVA